MTVANIVLFAVETVPLLFYIFMGLVVVAVPVAYIWDKVIQPKLDEKKKAQKEARKAAAEAEQEAAADEDAAAIGEGDADMAMPGDDDAELAMPDVGGEVAAELPAADPDDEVVAEFAFEEALPGDAFTEDGEEKPAE